MTKTMIDDQKTEHVYAYYLLYNWLSDVNTKIMIMNLYQQDSRRFYA